MSICPQTLMMFILERIRLPEHPCPNQNGVCVPSAHDYQGIHAQTRFSECVYHSFMPKCPNQITFRFTRAFVPKPGKVHLFVGAIPRACMPKSMLLILQRLRLPSNLCPSHNVVHLAITKVSIPKIYVRLRLVSARRDGDWVFVGTSGDDGLALT